MLLMALAAWTAVVNLPIAMISDLQNRKIGIPNKKKNFIHNRNSSNQGLVRKKQTLSLIAIDIHRINRAN